ncbi:MAG: phospholipase D-like domain-containing protein, partial [Candidatus Dormibacteria bacterium]
MHPSRRSRSPRSPLRLFLVAGLVGCAPVASRAAPAAPLAAYPAEAGPPVRAGDDTVTVLPRGVVAFPVIRRLIETARRRVDVEIYEFGRADLATALVDAHRRGLEVTVITDPSVAA